MYPLAAQPDAVPQTGQGRIVRLRKPVRLKGLIERLRTHLGVRHLHVAAGDGRMIRTVGLCAGAGGSLLDEAGDIDAFFTGEMRHHDILDAQQRGIAVILAGHTETERPYLKVLRDRLAATAGDLTITVSRSDLSPLRVL